MIDGAPRSGSVGRMLVLAVGSVVLLVIGWALLVLGPSGVGQSPSQSSESLPGGGDFLASGPTFASFDQMVATADLVATGTVTEVLPGEIEGAGTRQDTPTYPEGGAAEVPQEEVQPPDPAGVDAVRYRNAVIRLDNVMKGNALTGVITVAAPQLAYAPPHEEWRRPGERVFLFLLRGSEPGLYIPANHSQSVYRISQGGGLFNTTTGYHAPVDGYVETLSPPQLGAQVQEAKAKIASGEVKPLDFENPGEIR